MIQALMLAASIGTLNLTADRIAVDNVTKAAVASGHVHVVEGVVSLRSDYMERTADGVVKLHDPSQATTCTNAPGCMHWNVEGEVEYRARDYVVLRNMWVKMFEVPVLWLPYFWYPLDTKCGFSWMPGYTSRWGAYLLTKYRYHILGDEKHDDEGMWLKGATRFDMRFKNGLALGEDLDWSLGSFGRGSFKAYYAFDENARERYGRNRSESKWNYNNWGSSVSRDRYGFEGSHFWEPTERDTVLFRGSHYSDSHFRNDFYRRTFFGLNNQFVSYDTSGVFWEHTENLFSFGAEADGRLDEFISATERLPEVYFDVNPTPVFSTPLNYESQSRLGYLRRRGAEYSSRASDGYRVVPGEWAKYEAVRMDTYHRLTAPTKLFDDLISFVPRFAYRGTFYDDGGIAPLDGVGRAKSSGSAFARSIIEGGATFAARGEAEIGENYLHTIEPYLDVLAQEAYLSGADGNARAYVFDALDASRTWEDQFAGRGRNLPYSWYGVTPGWRNEWSKVDEKGEVRTVVDLDVYAAIQFNSAHYLDAPANLDNSMHRLPVSGKPSYGEGDACVVPGARVRYSPNDDCLLSALAEYDSDNNKIALADVRFSKKVDEDFSWYAAYSLRDHRLWDFASSLYNPMTMKEDIFNEVLFHYAEVGFTHQPIDWFRYSPYVRWDIDENELDRIGTSFDFLTDCLGFRFYVEYENDYIYVDGYKYDHEFNFGFQIFLRAFGDGDRAMFY